MRLLLRSCSIGAIAMAVAFTTAPVLAQKPKAEITVTVMPLGKALEEISAQSGLPIAYDPDGVAGYTSVPVAHAKCLIQKFLKRSNILQFCA